MLVRLVLSLVCVAVLSACERTVMEPVKPPFYWVCDDVELAAVPAMGGVELYLPARDMEVVGDDRFRYTEAGAEVVLGDRTLSCTPKLWRGPWAAARDRGVEMRAVGQEPGWVVELVEGTEILLALDYGTRSIAVPTPPVTLLGGARGYHVASAEHGVVMVLIEDLPCFDIMSGEVYPETVTVQVADERFSGCGVTF